MKSQPNRRDFIKTLGMGAATLSLAGSPSRANYINKKAKANIILIMADDVSPDMYGCYGNRDVKTPNIDRMAEQGVMFRTCWATALCTPTRAEIMSGRYAHRTGFYSNGLTMDPVDGGRDLHKNNHSFAWLVKKAGYATAIAGKWHLGSGTPYSERGGFDEYCLWEGIGEIKKLSGQPEYQGGWENQDTTSRYWHPAIVKNRKLVQTNPNDFGPDIFTDFICDFIERKKDGPFLAYYPMVAPHGSRKGHTTTPVRGKKGHMEKDTAKEEQAKFKALNEYIDVLVGRIINKVETLGLAEQTIIMFTSDNGTAVTAKSRGVERGCRVPFVVFGGGVKKRGATDELTDFSDVLPTLVDFAGAVIPKGYEIDGKSLKPFLTGKSDSHRDWICSSIGTTQLVRDRRYLLEAVNPMLGMPSGRLFDCGNNRDGRGYKNVSNAQQAKNAKEKFAKILSKFPPITKDHPVFKTTAGKRWLKAYMQPQAVEKHLHNHRNYQFYQE